MPERVVAVLLVLVLALSACGDDEAPTAVPVQPPESSWVPGQGSLAMSPAYLSIAQRAELQGRQRMASRLRTIEVLAARKKAAQAKKRADALRRYRIERAKAMAKYRAALRKAALERARLKARQERLKREHERRMRELLKKLRVAPGRECEVEAVRREIDCVSGRLPIGKKK